MVKNNVGDIRDRIRYLREKILIIKQNEMSLRLGLKQGSLSDIERKKTKNVTDRVINDICREFSVSEEWLRYGTGNPIKESDTFSLDEYAKANKLTSLELDIIKSYMELDNETRNKLMSHLKNAFTRHFNDETSAAKESTDNDTPTTSPEDVENFEEYKKREVEAYAIELDAESKGEILSVSGKQKGA
ncbi:helix-turn-helix domain-containing protein [Clostridium coskatii]|uniref:Helix-turn-helix domain protein n=1 Tax=Clostridium coskatii TaxID=1705578 RepID=A0A166TUH4_9CLOT|nr:helix-turn-helix transcriptional regulator [Clostridium coskatii]OAA94110.1 Helix-turn-helix domain protein [Clostridium coskatii]OBR96672.1 helix-turn-helix domain protein [Clostridium coskatii]